jgi:hypothetical protein
MAAQITGNSREGVALDLMLEIAKAEASTAELKKRLENPRVYYLKLYQQCYAVAGGLKADSALAG